MNLNEGRYAWSVRGRKESDQPRDRRAPRHRLYPINSIRFIGVVFAGKEATGQVVWCGMFVWSVVTEEARIII